MSKNRIRFIDLFAGMGGIRLGFEQAAHAAGLTPSCVLTSEIKTFAVDVYKHNFNNEDVHGDITAIDAVTIPDFDFLLAGFPCQPFSQAGSRHGFHDTRGTLFFEIQRILEAKKPHGFLLENVEGLVNHEGGKTLEIILEALKHLGYHVNYKVLNAVDFGVPQDRKRIFIVGHLQKQISLEFEPITTTRLGNLFETGKPTIDSNFTRNLLSRYAPEELNGKSIKDKRGGDDNIHSWDIELKGSVSATQKRLLEMLLRERRKKQWAEQKGIRWMDGMPLTLAEIETFFFPEGLFDTYSLKEILDDLVHKGYLAFEHPKDIVVTKNNLGKKIEKREPRTDLAPGYNIVVGKLSFEINKILDPDGTCPTLVATDMSRLAVVDQGKLRRLTLREGMRLNGFPDSFEMRLSDDQGYDLLGNSVAVPVVAAIAKRLMANKNVATFIPTKRAKKYPAEIFLYSSD